MKTAVKSAPAVRPWTRGAALFYALLVSVLMLVIVIPFLFSLSSRFRVTEKSYKAVAATNLAEAGLERAIWELNYGDITLWNGDPTARTLTLSSVQAAGGTVVGNIDIEVQNPAGDYPVIISTGTVPWPGGLGYAKRIRARLKHGIKPYFDFGVFTKDGLSMQGNAYIDSYDSTEGPYDPDTRRYNGNVGTNASEQWDVVLLNNTVVFGDCATGFESDPALVIELRNHAQIMGETSALPEPKPLPSVQPPLLTQKGAFAVATGDYTATITESGEYSSFSLDSNSKVTIVGDIQLYVNGDFWMDSNTIVEIAPGSTLEIYLGNGVFNQDSNSQINNLNQDPKSLAILGTADFHTLNWRSNSALYGVMYVPDADVLYSANADTFGAIVARYIDQDSQAGIHYDESLATWEKYGTVDTKYVLQDWQEY
jgi:hypothetical protein